MVRIRDLRDAHGLTAEQLADRMAELGVRVDRNTIYNIELGAKKPSERVLNAYARALGVNPLNVWQGPLRRLARSNRAGGGSALPPGSATGHQSGLVWHGYVERHAISDARRKPDGATRTARAPEVELATPDRVADWLARRATEIGRTAEPNARRLNALTGNPWSVNRGVAAKGRSVYATVHVGPGRVIDLCAEVVRPTDPGEPTERPGALSR